MQKIQFPSPPLKIIGLKPCVQVAPSLSPKPSHTPNSTQKKKRKKKNIKQEAKNKSCLWKYSKKKNHKVLLSPTNNGCSHFVFWIDIREAVFTDITTFKWADRLDIGCGGIGFDYKMDTPTACKQ